MFFQVLDMFEEPIDVVEQIPESEQRSRSNTDPQSQLISTWAEDASVLPWVESSKLPKFVLKFKEKEKREANKVVKPVAPWTIDDVVWKNYASNARKQEHLLQEYKNYARKMIKSVKLNHWALEHVAMDIDSANSLRKEIVSTRKKLGISFPMFDHLLLDDKSSNSKLNLSQILSRCPEALNSAANGETMGTGFATCENSKQRKRPVSKNEPTPVRKWLSCEQQKVRGKRKAYIPRKITNVDDFLSSGYYFMKKKESKSRSLKLKENKSIRLKQENDARKHRMLICDDFSANAKNRAKNQKKVLIGKKRVCIPPKKDMNEILAAFGLTIDRFDHVPPHMQTSLEKKVALDVKKRAMTINDNFAASSTVPGPSRTGMLNMFFFSMNFFQNHFNFLSGLTLNLVDLTYVNSISINCCLREFVV